MAWYADHVLPRVLNLVMDTAHHRRIRVRVCAGLRGDVVEIGFGTGQNVPHLPSQVTRLLAVEPSRLSVRLAGSRIADSRIPVEVAGLDGQRLALPDGSADAALCTWSLCTIPDPIAAVREVRRVLRPGGELHFVEHGLAPDERVRRWQSRLNGIQQRLAGGCHLDRDIRAIVERGGMLVTHLETYYEPGAPKTLGAMYEGTAVAA